jgi:phosphoribosylpyrophosphate synthetase
MTYALDMFERLPLKMDSLDTKDCHISSMIVSQDPEGLKKAQDMAKALGDFITEYNIKAARAAAAASAASH